MTKNEAKDMTSYQVEKENMKKACEMAKQYVKEGCEDYSIVNGLWDFCYKHDIFFYEDEEYIMVEDEVFYFNA